MSNNNNNSQVSKEHLAYLKNQTQAYCHKSNTNCHIGGF